MELLKLSKFKLQLRTLISEVKQLKERESSAYDQVRVLTQKQKLREEEFSRKLMEFQAELCSSNEIRQKLEKKVNCLERENDLLENKQKELKETISSLLQSKESFVQVYEESYGELRRAVEERERKIIVLSEKIKAHTLLFDTIEKEANSIKQVVHNAECAIKDREEIEKINNLERKLRDDEDELKRKEKLILGLEAQLEAKSFTDDFQPRIDKLQKALSSKELVIHNLLMEKQALQCEVGNLGVAMKKVQDAVSHMDKEDRKAFSSMLNEPEECITIGENGVNSIEDVQADEDVIHHNTSKKTAVETSASRECQDCSAMKSFKEDGYINSCVSESACSQPQLARNAVSSSTTEEKDELTKSRDTVDSECSGIKTGTS